MLDKDSVEAGIYEMFQRHVMANVKDTIVPASARDYITPPMTRIIASLTAPDGSYLFAGITPATGVEIYFVNARTPAGYTLTTPTPGATCSLIE